MFSFGLAVTVLWLYVLSNLLTENLTLNVYCCSSWLVTRENTRQCRLLLFLTAISSTWHRSSLLLCNSLTLKVARDLDLPE